MSGSTICGRKAIWIGPTAVLGAVLLAVKLGPPCEARAAGDKPRETVNLVVYHEPSPKPPEVWVTLLSDGKAVRSKQLRPDGPPTDRQANWEGLPTGSYELQFEADGYEKDVKRIVLSKEDRELQVRVSLTKKVGSGDAAFRELAERVKKLEEGTAELRATVDRLQKEIDQLKKK
jgi:hypothetical protein